jgi:predicted Zn-dependent peptidase
MYQKTVLENGIKIITEEISHVRSAGVGIWVGCGAKDEREDELGFSHFVEHMLFKGTKKRTQEQIAKEIEAVGGHINASTAKEYTFYYVWVLSDYLELSLDLLLDMVLNSLFPAKEIEKEKKIVLEEIKMYEDSPGDLIHDIFVQTIWKGHRLGQNILGKKEIIENINREKLLQYFHRYYTPDNIIISCAGYLKHEKVLKKVKKMCKNFKGKRIKNFDTKPNIVNSVYIKRKDTEQVHLCLGTEGVFQTHPDKYVLGVLDIILGNGMSSRLYQEVREKKGLAYSIYSYEHSYRKAGIFGVYAGVSPNNFEKAVETILKNFEKIKKNGVKNEELKRTKDQVKGNMMLSLESTFARMLKLGKSEFYFKREITLDEILSEINKVKNEDIVRVANSLFQKEKFTLAALGNVSEKQEENIKNFLR